MDRRIVLTGALAFAATPALAQSTPPSPTDAPAPAMKMAAPAAVSDSSAEHVKKTLAAGSLSLAVSRIAADKVRHPMLRQFVGFEIAEQETIASILKAMMMPGTPPSGMVTPPTDAEVAGNLDAAGKATVEKMKTMKAGPAFERDYVKAQIDGHHTLLAIQEAYLKAPGNAEETAVAQLAKGMITEHLTLLGDIEKTVG